MLILDPDDYMGLRSANFTINIKDTSTCRHIILVSDDALEHHEDFTISFEYLDRSAIVLGNNFVVITIINDDSKLY